MNATLLSEIEKLGLPLVKEAWVKVIHPLIVAEEAKIGSATVKAIVVAVDAALEPVLEKALDDAAASIPSA